MLIIVQSGLQIIATVIVLRFHYSQNKNKEMKQKQQFLVFNCIKPIVSKLFTPDGSNKICNEKLQKVEEMGNEEDSQPETRKHNNIKDSKLSNMKKEESGSCSTTEQWEKATSIMDKFFFIIFLFSATLINAFFFISVALY